jgi:phosphatidate cytidylyltransferase
VSAASAAPAEPPAPAPGGDAARPRRALLGLGARVAAAAVFLPCFAIIAWRGDVYFVLLVDFIAVLAQLEFLRMLAAKGLRPQRATALAASIALPWLAYVHGGAWMGFGLTLAVVATMTVELARNRGEPLVHIATALLGTLYVAWLASHLVALRELPLLLGRPAALGALLVGFVFVTTWMADTGAYVVGSLWGRHKLAPRISPGKSVEGAVGGVAFAVAAGWVVARVFLSGTLTPLAGAALGGVAALVGLAGDLAESLLKRDAHVKDASGAIPGHGGMLDRFDSVLFSAPLLYYVLRFFVL